MTRLGSARMHARGSKAVSLLLFLLIGVPVFLFGTAVAIDLGRLIVEYNQNVNIAEAAAVAGTTARDLNTGQLDAAEATRRANDLCSRMGRGPCASTSGPLVTAAVPMGEFPLFGNWLVLPMDGGRILSLDFSAFTATRTASVCNSYVPTGTSDQYCVRPRS